MDRGADEQPSSRSAAFRSVRAFVEHPDEGSCGSASGPELKVLQAGLLDCQARRWLGGRQVQSVSWSSGRRASDRLTEPEGQALCARPSCRSVAAAAAGGSRIAARSRSAAIAPWPSCSVARLESCRSSSLRRTVKSLWFRPVGAMGTGGTSPRPNNSLKRGRATAWRLGREAALVYRRPRGPGAKLLRAA